MSKLGSYHALKFLIFQFSGEETLQKYIYGQFIVEGYWIIASLSGGVDFDFFFEVELYDFRLSFEFLLLIIPSKDMYQS